MFRHKKVLAATKTSGPSGPTRIQSTGKVSASSSTNVVLTLASPPSVGNSVVIAAIMYDNNGNTLTCVDNRGNTYTQAVKIVAAASYIVIIYVCNVITTGGPFSVTLTCTSGPGYFHACGIELSGQVVVDKIISATGNSTAPNTGTTAPLTGTNVFVVAAHTNQANQSSIVVQSVTPPWTEEVENLSSATVPGEIDYRSLNGVMGTNQSCAWVDSATGQWGAALAVFK